MTAAQLKACADYLEATYLPRLRAAAAVLPPEDLWWRPYPDCIAFGTILVHLEGNVRQWILAGVLGADDHRARSAEFRADASSEPRSVAELLAALAGTVGEAAAGIRGLDSDRAGAKLQIQGFDTTVEGAVLHVTEHFSWHTGQAVWIAKARAGAGHGLAFYNDAELE